MSRTNKTLAAKTIHGDGDAAAGVIFRVGTAMIKRSMNVGETSGQEWIMDPKRWRTDANSIAP